MTSYLIKGENPSFTAAEICEELGIDSQYFELLISSIIASTCLRQRCRVETYAVTVGPDFDRQIVWPGGRTPTDIGPEYDFGDYGRVRDCRYEPSPERIAKARETVINWCLNSNDRALIAALKVGERSRALLTQQLEASLAEAV